MAVFLLIPSVFFNWVKRPSVGEFMRLKHHVDTVYNAEALRILGYYNVLLFYGLIANNADWFLSARQ